jgi:methyl-accepting chemotaxis protein
MDDIPIDGKKLVWLPVEIADAIKNATSPDSVEEISRRVIKKRKLDIQRALEDLDDTLLAFKAASATFRKGLEEAYQKEEKKIREIEDTALNAEARLRKLSERVAGAIRPIREQVEQCLTGMEELQNIIHSLDIYGAETILSVAEKVSQLDEKSKHILGELLLRKKESSDGS